MLFAGLPPHRRLVRLMEAAKLQPPHDQAYCVRTPSATTAQARSISEDEKDDLGWQLREGDRTGHDIEPPAHADRDLRKMPSRIASPSTNGPSMSRPEPRAATGRAISSFVSAQVLVLHERKSRETLAPRLAGKTAAETISVMLAVFARVESDRSASPPGCVFEINRAHFVG
jgi:hypothetical protein